MTVFGTAGRGHVDGLPIRPADRCAAPRIFMINRHKNLPRAQHVRGLECR